MTYSCSERLNGASDAREFRSRLEGELGAADELTAIWVDHPVLAAGYESGFDLVGVVQITTNSPCRSAAS
jgi:hypothetical protein